MTIQPHDAPVHSAMNPEVDESLARGREGASVDREAVLLFAEQAPLSALLAAATEIRAAGKGNVVSFSKKVFIPLTTLCRDYCSYCTFRKNPGQPGAHFMTPEEVRALDYLAAMCELVLEKTGLLPHANPGLMDRAALVRLRDSNASVGLMLENVSPRLMRDGLPHT